MQLRDAVTVTDIPSPGALMGTTGSAQLVQSINEQFGGAGFFGSVNDAYTSVTNAFIRNIVRPMQAMEQSLQHLSRTLFNPDEIRALVTMEDYKYIPPCMQLPIVMYTPVRKLLEQGRVSGFGYDVENLPDENPFERIVNNGYCEDILEAATAAGSDYISLEWEWRDDDPDLSIDEIENVAATFEYVDYILANTLMDPTDIVTERG